MHVANKAGMGIGVVLLIALVGGAIFVGYRFYRNTTKPFQFHYFKVRLELCTEAKVPVGVLSV